LIDLKSEMNLKKNKQSSPPSSPLESARGTDGLSQRKAQIETRIEQNNESLGKLLSELPNRVEDEDARAFLQLLYKNQVLEIEAMDREEQVNRVITKHAETLREKNEEIQNYKNIINELKSLIPQNIQIPTIHIGHPDSPCQGTPSLNYTTLPMPRISDISDDLPNMSKMRGLGTTPRNENTLPPIGNTTTPRKRVTGNPQLSSVKRPVVPPLPSLALSARAYGTVPTERKTTRKSSPRR
jgi:hypothetical protein